MNPLDLITAGVSIVEKLVELHKLNEWAKLIFGFVFTFVTVGATACGTNLIKGNSYAISFGWGLVSASGAITALFFYNPRTRGIMIVQDKSNLPAVDMSKYQSIEKK